jgi:hypothetical protein
LVKVKSLPISPLHPDVPKMTFAGAIFSLANFSIVGSKPLFFDASDSIVFQHEAAFSNSRNIFPPFMV